mmetsp:Transcript_1029/g.2507  ORF Transcript_1029/g.2507 Transcript_1029/m.2507 type:complete len:91 (+) Transcript_1029:353-625(+)
MTVGTMMMGVVRFVTKPTVANIVDQDVRYASGCAAWIAPSNAKDVVLQYVVTIAMTEGEEHSVESARSSAWRRRSRNQEEGEREMKRGGR